MESHADTERRPRPVHSGERSLRLRSGGDGVRGTLKRDAELITCGREHVAAPPLELVSQGPVVNPE
jgi:hypothetical protein